jgi:hypothetical protein
MSLSIKYRPKTQILDFGTTKLRIIPERTAFSKDLGLPSTKGLDGILGKIPGLTANIQGNKISVETSGSLMISNTILILA